MRTGRSTGKPTAAQVARFEAIHRIGCVACRKRGEINHAEIHHLTTGGLHGQKRRGHDYVVGLCVWHHRGAPFPTLEGRDRTAADCLQELGFSYARDPRRFREIFGRDEELLAYQNDLIASLEEAA